MLPFRRTTLLRMREVQDGHMQDVAHILEWSTTWEDTDDYGIPEDGWTALLETKCGLKLYSPKEIQASGEVPVVMGELRMPIGTKIDTRSRIRITERYGEALVEPMLFDIEGPVRRGPSGLLIFLRTVDEDAAGVNNERRTDE